MTHWKESLHRLTYLFRRPRFDSELDAELQFHIESRADELVEAGLPQRRRPGPGPPRIRLLRPRP